MQNLQVFNCVSLPRYGWLFVVVGLTLSACQNQTEDAWRADGVVYSANLQFADAVAVLGGEQGTPEEFAVTQDFLQSEGVKREVRSEFVELLRELLEVDSEGDVYFYYTSIEYARLVAPSAKACDLLERYHRQITQ